MSRSILKFVRVSPIKARLVAREIQGMNGEIALASLEFTPNKAAKIISKVLASAISNGDFEPEEIVVKSCRVDSGPVLKRFRPRARGSASRIRKPTAHILVEVESIDSESKEVVKKHSRTENTSQDDVKTEKQLLREES
jgi:large subunit ribosomal protein L22